MKLSTNNLEISERSTDDSQMSERSTDDSQMSERSSDNSKMSERSSDNPQMCEENPQMCEELNLVNKFLYDCQFNYYHLTDNDKLTIMATINKIQLDKKIPIKYKPIEYIQPKTEECSICCNSFNHDTPISQCCQCGQHLHSDCLIKWCYEYIKWEPSVTCPFCRAKWGKNEKLYYPLVSSESVNE